MTFGRELVVLLAKPSMLGKFLVHAWEVVWSLNKECFISVHGGSNSFWHAKSDLYDHVLIRHHCTSNHSLVHEKLW